MIDTGLKGKVVLVTGANHGIGAATAKAFAAEGAAVFINYLRLSLEDYGVGEEEANRASTPGEAFYRAQQTKSADEVVRAIRERGGHAEVWEADLADPAIIPQLFDRVEATFGSVDVLVNNAADWEADTFIPLGPKARDWMARHIRTITPESHDRHFAVNSRGAAKEVGKYGITVNIVAPGPIQTGWLTPELEEKELPTIPLGRLGQPEDVADVIVFLASEQARWLTGQRLFVGGGHDM